MRSPFAASKGLGTSLLERLIQRAAKDPDAAQVVRLSDNYRAHGSLLALPSKLFYDGSLRAKADEAVTASLLGWEKTALLCWGVNGSAAHELDSPSYFNALECAKVAQLVESQPTEECERLHEPASACLVLGFGVLGRNMLAGVGIEQAALDEDGRERTVRVTRPEGAVSVEAGHWCPAVCSSHRAVEQGLQPLKVGRAPPDSSQGGGAGELHGRGSAHQVQRAEPAQHLLVGAAVQVRTPAPRTI